MIYRLSLFALAILLAILAWQLARLTSEVYRIDDLLSSSNHVECPEGSIAKIIEDNRVSCVLRKAGYGESTVRVPSKGLAKNPTRNVPTEK